MATKLQKVDFIYNNFKFKGGMTKKELNSYPEEELDKIIKGYENDMEKWLNQPKLIKYMVDGKQNGKVYSWDIHAENDNELLNYCKSEGIEIKKFVKARGHHRCMYCGGIAEGTQKNVLCKECRDTFGHYTYDEL